MSRHRGIVVVLGFVICVGSAFAQDAPDAKWVAKPAEKTDAPGSSDTVSQRVLGDRGPALALNWLARHQNHDGSWGFHDFEKQCTDKSCAGTGDSGSETAATALGVLSFLSFGQTHESKGPYQQHVKKALDFLINAQDRTVNVGDLTGKAKSTAPIDAHGLATLALCEAYDLTQDKRVGEAAQKAVDYIVATQNGATGGWRYDAQQEDNLSILGWRIMALANARFAGLTVPDSTWAGAKKWLKSCAHGEHSELFSDTPAKSPTPTMTAVGLLTGTYLGVIRKYDTTSVASMEYIVKHLPDEKEQNAYYWYFATKALKAAPGRDWETWARSVRPLLISSQVKEGCAAGSWQPQQAEKDEWQQMGGRLMVTSLGSLILSSTGHEFIRYKLTDNPRSSDQPSGKKQ